MDGRGRQPVSHRDWGYSIGCIDPATRSYRRVLTRDELYWPDDVIPGPDDALYVVVSQLPTAPPLNEGQRQPSFPFLVVRFWPETSPDQTSFEDRSAFSGSG